MLDVRLLLRERRQKRADRLEGTITWSNRDTPEAPASCAFTLNLADPQEAWLELKYYAGQEPVVCRITLVRASSFGGRHSGFQWFRLCPEEQCGRRVWKVFCRPDVPDFRCAMCHGLTYPSRQTAHWDDRGDMAAAARAMGIPLPVWKAYVRRYAGPTPLLPLDRL